MESGITTLQSDVSQLQTEVASTPSNAWTNYKSEVGLATSICHAAATRGNAADFLSIIAVPYNFSNSAEPSAYGDDINSECHTEVNTGWHACGVVKDYFQGQGCAPDFGGSVGAYDNHDGSYTSYIPVSAVSTGSWHDGTTSCTSGTNVWICCSP